MRTDFLHIRLRICSRYPMCQNRNQSWFVFSNFLQCLDPNLIGFTRNLITYGVGGIGLGLCNGRALREIVLSCGSICMVTPIN